MFLVQYVADLRAGRHRRLNSPRPQRSTYIVGVWAGLTLLAATAGASLHGIVTSLATQHTPGPPSPQSAQVIGTYPTKTPPTTPGGIVPRSSPAPTDAPTPTLKPEPEPVSESESESKSKRPSSDTPKSPAEKPSKPEKSDPPATPSVPEARAQEPDRHTSPWPGYQWPYGYQQPWPGAWGPSYWGPSYGGPSYWGPSYGGPSYWGRYP
jgi:outer membrane biosynthesis protein TonB